MIIDKRQEAHIVTIDKRQEAHIVTIDKRQETHIVTIDKSIIDCAKSKHIQRNLNNIFHAVMLHDFQVLQ